MKDICIHLPPMDGKQTIDLEVKLNGQTHLMSYRVETFDWTRDGGYQGGKIHRLRQFIADYDAGWELVQIGSMSEENIAVMFRQRT